MQGIRTVYAGSESGFKRCIFLNIQLPSRFGTMTHFKIQRLLGRGGKINQLNSKKAMNPYVLCNNTYFIMKICITIGFSYSSKT